MPPVFGTNPIYSGVGYRARALAYSLGCFREALLLRPLFAR